MKNNSKNGLNLNSNEDTVLTAVLSGQNLDYSQMNAFVSALINYKTKKDCPAMKRSICSKEMFMKRLNIYQGKNYGFLDFIL